MRAKTSFLLFLLLGWFSGIPLLQAQDKKITRLEAITIGVSKNLELLIDQLEKERKQLQLTAVYQDYVPSISLYSNYSNTTPSEIDDERDTNLYYGSAISWKTPIGTEVNLGTSVAQNLSGLTTPEHEASVYFSVNQPLLKGGWLSGAAINLLVAKVDLKIQHELFRSSVNEFITKVESAYWELALAQADVEIKKRSLDRAKKQFKDTQENITRGIIADVEIYVVEENLVFFEQELLQSQEKLVLAQRQLAYLLLFEDECYLEATDPLVTITDVLPQAHELIAQGLATNPDILAQQLYVTRSKMFVNHEKNQLLPDVAIEASVAVDGYQEEYNTMWEEVVNSRRPAATVGLVFEIPFYRGFQRAALAGQEMAMKQQQLQLKSVRVTMQYQIKNLLSQIQAQNKRLLLAQRRVELGELKLEAEVEKYKSGISTLTDVVRFQRELDEALISVKRHQKELLVHRIYLLKEQGVLSESVGITAK